MPFSLFSTSFPFSELFVAQAGRLASGAAYLEEALFDVSKALPLSREIECLGAGCRVASEEVLSQLSLVGIRPIDRGDVQALDSAFAEAFGAVDSVAVRLALFKPSHVRGPAGEVAGRITRMATEIRAGVALLARSGANDDSWRRVTQARVQAKGLVVVGLGGLHDAASIGDLGPLEAIVWTQLYDRLEAAVDRTARVADVLHGVLLKQD